MKYNGVELWDSFKESIKKNIELEHIDNLNAAWDSCGNRTEFYKQQLFTKISDDLGLEYVKKEYLTVDATFYKRGSSKYLVPIIHIESENNAASTDNEVYKLCCFNAPLKVLFICCDWNEKIKRDYTIDYWNFIINDFKEISQLIGILGIVVAQWDDNGLRFDCFAYGENGSLMDKEEVIQCSTI